MKKMREGARTYVMWCIHLL